MAIVIRTITVPQNPKAERHLRLELNEGGVGCAWSPPEPKSRKAFETHLSEAELNCAERNVPQNPKAERHLRPLTILGALIVTF